MGVYLLVCSIYKILTGKLAWINWFLGALAFHWNWPEALLRRPGVWQGHFGTSFANGGGARRWCALSGKDRSGQRLKSNNAFWSVGTVLRLSRAHQQTAWICCGHWSFENPFKKAGAFNRIFWGFLFWLLFSEIFGWFCAAKWQRTVQQMPGWVFIKRIKM